MRRCIQICHSDETIVAEMSFWATSAGYDLVPLKDKSDLLGENQDGIFAYILELTGTCDEEVDVIEALVCAHAREGHCGHSTRQ